jgi:prepilin-type N-terminal cleavage/methylation domain-containing protein
MYKLKSNLNSVLKKAFTLIELLIVIAIIGLLAIIVLTLIDPSENNAKARDAGRIAAVTQLGKSVVSYNVNSDDTSFPDINSWDTDLVATGQPASFPAGVKYTLTGSYTCQTFVRPSTNPTYCYDVDLNFKNAIVFSAMESKSQKTRCSGVGENTYFVFSSVEGSSGFLCGISDPVPWEKGTVTYVK